MCQDCKVVNTFSDKLVFSLVKFHSEELPRFLGPIKLFLALDGQVPSVLTDSLY